MFSLTSCSTNRDIPSLRQSYKILLRKLADQAAVGIMVETALTMWIEQSSTCFNLKQQGDYYSSRSKWHSVSLTVTNVITVSTLTIYSRKELAMQSQSPPLQHFLYNLSVRISLLLYNLSVRISFCFWNHAVTLTIALSNRHCTASVGQCDWRNWVALTGDMFAAGIMQS